MFLAIEILGIIGCLTAGPTPMLRIGDATLDYQIVYTLTVIVGMNVTGIGALILSLIAWKRHGNSRGKNTAIAAVIVIGIMTALLL